MGHTILVYLGYFSTDLRQPLWVLVEQYEVHLQNYSSFCEMKFIIMLQTEALFFFFHFHFLLFFFFWQSQYTPFK